MVPEKRLRQFASVLIAIIVLVDFGAIAIRASGQLSQGTTPATIKVASELVLVPVVVADHSGNFLHGLTKNGLSS